LNETITITEAKARLSELVVRLIHRKDKIFITRKGKPAAVLMPFDAYNDLIGKSGRSLIKARGALAGYDAEIDEICAEIYKEREKEEDREIPF
jgi:prevent-host-death family protein